MSEVRKVVVIQDLSRETSLKGTRALKGLPLKPGDEITFLGILHQVNNPMGYKMKADNANPLIVEEEFSRKTDEYNCNVHNTGIVRHWKNIKIRVEVKVIYGPSAKKVALAAAKDLGATWVILDRQMKRDKKYFIDELPKCRISRLKRDNTIEELQGMKLGEDAAIERGLARNVTYGERIPGTPDKSPDRNTSKVEPNMPRNVSCGEMVPGISEDSPDSKKIPNLVHFQQSESVKSATEVMNVASEASGSGTTGGPQLLQSSEQNSISLPADDKGEEWVKPDLNKLSPPSVAKIAESKTKPDLNKLSPPLVAKIAESKKKPDLIKLFPLLVTKIAESETKPDLIKLSPPLVTEISEKRTLLLTAAASSSSLANTEASSSSQTDAKTSPFHNSDGVYTTNTELEELSPQTMISPDSPFLDHSDYEEFPGLYQTKDVFKNSVCSCGNRRPVIGWSKEFRYAELNKATEGFAPKNFLSEGGFGSVYRGRLKNGMYVAVKQHKHASLQGEKEFKSEVNVLSKARNENLVMLLGSCTEGTNRLLVYEYVCNGSLDQLLSKHSRRPFRWEKRIKIASGAARGLKYLHENSIIHRDVRPNNILVTHDHESLLGDFGLARAHEADHSSETRVVGTLGYLAPEYAESGKVSTKTDVYAFGVVLLQLITGFTTNDKQLKGRSLVGWARPLLKEGNYPLLVDERISEYYDVHHLYWMVRVAEKCLSKDPQKRPTMAIVVQILDYLANGDPTSSVRAFSPAESDTFSVAESIISDEDTEAEKGSTFSGRTSVSNRSKRSGKFSPRPGYESSTRRQSVLTMSKLSQDIARKEKVRGLMQVKSSLHYNEMVD